MRMAAAVATLVAFATFFSLPAWAALRRRGQMFLWDWGLSVYPVLFWLLLYRAGVGDPHPGNVIELALVGMAVMPASYLRAFGLSRWISRPAAHSLLTIALTLLFALLLRLVVPPLL